VIRISNEFHSAKERRLVASLWAFAVVLGLSQAWSWRFYIEPDGVSYIEIAHAYIQRDFAHAVNAYWSPLYSWLLALVISVAHVPEYREATCLHLVNFFIYLLSLASFAFFFAELTSSLSASAGETPSRSRWVWNVFGFSLFYFAAFQLVGVGIDQPDLIVLAVSLLATGLLIRMKRGVASRAAYVALGVALATGYLAKAVMFPLTFVFLFCSLFAAGSWKRSAPRTAIALVTFLLVASPWILTLSKAEGRFTFGDTGRLNYAFYVNDLVRNPYWHGEIPALGTPTHGGRRLNDIPPVEEVSGPGPGSYALWYDPTYWFDGVRPHFEWQGQLRVLRTSFGEYFHMLSAQKGIATAFLTLVFFSGRRGEWPKEFAGLWPVWLPAAGTLTIYSLVHAESRFIGASVIVVWSCLFAAVRLPVSDWSPRLYASCLAAACVAISISMTAQFARDFSQIAKGQVNRDWQIAQDLRRLGINSGDSVALLGHEGHPKAIDYYWAHLGHIRIVAEIPSEGVAAFWTAEPATRLRLFRLLSQTGARALITGTPPPVSQREDWQALGSTGYYAVLLAPYGSTATAYRKETMANHKATSLQAGINQVAQASRIGIADNLD
jgi:4-amino-4-deoxy-L-arabinose transferase-like glycosyltransferase